MAVGCSERQILEVPDGANAAALVDKGSLAIVCLETGAVGDLRLELPPTRQPTERLVAALGALSVDTAPHSTSPSQLYDEDTPLHWLRELAATRQIALRGSGYLALRGTNRRGDATILASYGLRGNDR